MTGIRYNGLCDVEARPCQEISLTNEAGTFAEVSGTVCEVVPVEVNCYNRNMFLAEIINSFETAFETIPK